MTRYARIDDYITQIKDILRGKSNQKAADLRKLIYKSRKILNRHSGKQYSVDQAVEKLLHPGWIKSVARFNPDEWQDIADRMYIRARKILGNVQKPEIILYPSFQRFNGRVYEVDRTPYIAASPDFPHTTGKNLQVLMAHEYAHFARWRKTGIPSENVPIYACIFEEGWATWMSIKLLPEYTLTHLFMSNLHKSIHMPDPKGGYLRWCKKHLKSIASEAAKSLNSKDHKALGRFFQCQRFGNDNTPIRTGYYLGYRMIDMLAGQMPARKLMLEKPTRRKVSGWLDQLLDQP
ncbi:MAG TPA: hypothetical protein ENO22_04440 [candidate division Zixibacteria bacterium]|nr:hypothetical protein [candidate division Zixibacteria bacterium]HEQ98574.1 hypothetical protein [candidate division Zixibacteria bacterium]